VHFTLPDTAQDDQEGGQANLYQIDLNDETPIEGRTFLTERLNDSSVRVGIRGDDAWSPGSCICGRSRDRLIIPLALSVVKQGFKSGENSTMVISTDRDEGRTSFCVQPGDDFYGEQTADTAFNDRRSGQRRNGRYNHAQNHRDPRPSPGQSHLHRYTAGRFGKSARK
jgi:hypothetical protein